MNRKKRKDYRAGLTNNQGHHFDYIRINCGRISGKLRKSLPVEKLKNHSHFFKIKKSSKQAIKARFQSSLIIVAPDKKFFDILLEYEDALDAYKISHLEIAKDTFFDSSGEEEKVFQEFKRTLHKKYSTKCVDRKYPDGSRFKISLHYGSRRFEFVLYTRSSKLNGEPCLHGEFRIERAYYIKKRTGIESIEDFIDCDVESLYCQLEEKYISHDQIDNVKLGKWLENLTWKRKFTEDELLIIKAYAIIFKRRNRATTFPELKNFFYIKKAEIKSKRGRRSNWENKILAVRYCGIFKQVL